jgi:transcriptional regulator with XRE-family HTH domain
MARRPRYSKRFLAELWAACEALGITGLQIAEAANVNPTHVYNVRAGRRRSEPVVATAIRLRNERQSAA